GSSGLGDVSFGFKYALLYCPEQVLTFQLRTTAPSGDASEGLGTNNWQVEPGLLYYQRLSDRMTLEAEVRDYIPIDSADDFAGNVIRYGVGLSYNIYDGPKFRIAPVVEFVGWSVLNGKVSDEFGNTADASGQTIVNGKFG